jgi:hypothetical protein
MYSLAKKSRFKLSCKQIRKYSPEHHDVTLVNKIHIFAFGNFFKLGKGKINADCETCFSRG